MPRFLLRRKKPHRSWHRSHWLHSKPLSNFCAVKFDPVSNMPPKTKWRSLAKERARRTPVRRLPLSSRRGRLDSIPGKTYSVGKLLASILEPVTYYGSLLLFLAAFVLTVSHGSHGFPVAEAGREACHLYSMDLTEIEGEALETVKGCGYRKHDFLY